MTKIYQRKYLTVEQQKYIESSTVITQKCFLDLIACEYHHKTKDIKVTYHPYKFLGGGVHLWIGKLHKNGNIIYKSDNHEDLLKAYSLQIINQYNKKEKIKC